MVVAVVVEQMTTARCWISVVTAAAVPLVIMAVVFVAAVAAEADKAVVDKLNFAAAVVVAVAALKFAVVGQNMMV